MSWQIKESPTTLLYRESREKRHQRTLWSCCDRTWEISKLSACSGHSGAKHFMSNTYSVTSACRNMTRGLNPRHHFEPLSALHHSLCSHHDTLAWSHYHATLRTIKDVRLILSKSTHQLKLGLQAISASFLICLLSGAICYLRISQIMYWEIRGHESLLNLYHVARRPQLLLNMFSLAFLANEKFISIEMSFPFCIIWVTTLI